MTARSEPYESIANYYDAIHGSLNDDLGFVLSLAASDGPVLELGCGTGRLLRPLARAGHHVLGMDRSPAMLRRARVHLAKESEAVRQRVALVCGTMDDFALSGKHFGLVIISYNTFMHLAPAQAAATCRNLRKYMASGGQLFIDLVNPLLVEQTPDDNFVTHERTLTDLENDSLVVVLAANQLDISRQILEITWIFDASPLQGGLVVREVAKVAYHYYFPHQLELILEEAGLQVTELYGNYNRAPYSEDAERLLVLARRPVEQKG